MPHPDAEHSLRIQLATALRERDEAHEELGRLKRTMEFWAKSYLEEHGSWGVCSNKVRAANAEEALAAARRECAEARALAEKWAMREAASVERGIRADADALSEIQGLQARVERLRGDLVKYGSHVDGCNGDDFCSCGLEVARLQAARATLAAPAAEGGKP